MVSPLVRSSSKPFGANFTILESSPWLRTIPVDQIWRWASNGLGNKGEHLEKWKVTWRDLYWQRLSAHFEMPLKSQHWTSVRIYLKDPFEYSTSEWQKLGNAGSLTLAGSPSITFFFSFSFSSIHSDYLLFHDYEIINTNYDTWSSSSIWKLARAELSMLAFNTIAQGFQC